MDDDISILEETAYEESLALMDDIVGDADDYYDHHETDGYSFDDEDLFAYRADRQAEYDDEWGDPLDMPSYGY